ncbi:hypothetical protein GSS88_00135 [Corynebacterium sp. 3HC-13]|uniref:hypothetical protein n=1 Tax=Corynebacterium poyangense TaxID=2684405 RepID=UPI001CCCA6E8|nr:hypothetical protein [Corynebacterium poyangense]MBZ8176218.1 hypothetical protein [Corynebacterium poyangense]
MKKLLAVVLAVGLCAAGCGTNDHDQEPPVEITGLHWVSGPSGLTYPTTDQGPFEKAPVPHGFDDSETGAVIAAVTGQVFMAGADDRTWPVVSQYLLEPGPGRDQWAQARSLISVNGTVAHQPEFLGYRVEHDNNTTVVVLATRYPTGEVTAYPIQVSHASGQWKVVVPSQGTEPDLTEINDDQLAQFISFHPDQG